MPLVNTFGDGVAADFAAGSKALTCFAGLKDLIARLDAAKSGQQTATGGTAKEVLFDDLRLDLQNIARTSRAIALEEPGFADSFRLPDVPTETSLLTTADAYLLRLAVKPEDDDATQARKAAIGPLLKTGNALVLTLDAIMHNKYAHQPEKLRAWLSASHVERAPRRETTPDPAPAPDVPSA